MQNVFIGFWMGHGDFSPSTFEGFDGISYGISSLHGILMRLKMGCNRNISDTPLPGTLSSGLANSHGMPWCFYHRSSNQ